MSHTTDMVGTFSPYPHFVLSCWITHRKPVVLSVYCGNLEVRHSSSSLCCWKNGWRKSVLLERWKKIFSTNLGRETVQLVEHSRGNLQKWSGSGSDVKRIKTHTHTRMSPFPHTVPIMPFNMLERKIEFAKTHASSLSSISQEDDVMFEPHILRQTL